MKARGQPNIERRYAELLELIPDAAFVWHLADGVESWNRGAEALYEFTAEEAFGQDPRRLLQTRFPYAWSDVEAELRVSGRWDGDLIHRTSGGRVVTVSARLQLRRDEDGVERILETNRDVTDRRQMELRLREHERFRTLAEALPQLVWSTDARGNIIYLNQRMLDYAGLAAEEAMGYDLHRVIHPEDVPRSDKQWNEALRTAGWYEMEYRLRRRDGCYRWFLARAFPLRDESGRVNHWLGTSTDIHDLKEAQEALRDADRRRSEFLGMLSHELRNPLVPIRNSLFILDRSPPGAADAERAKSVIERQVGQLARLVDDLLDVTRISQGRIALKKTHFELRDLVLAVIQDHRSLFALKGVHLEAHITPLSMWLTGDEARIGQAIGNLLQNASKFTPQGGRVDVLLDVEPDRRMAVIRVRDTGIGIRPEVLPRLFEFFMQEDSSLARSRGGLGLGLALVKLMIQMHGGSVEAASEGVDRGAEFTIHLPVDDNPRPAAIEAAPSLSSPQSRRVLVIEDNVDAAESLREVLELCGHTVAVAYDGASGIAKARAFAPDFVLCDIGLPGINGYDVARALRAEETLRSCVLVALSGYARPEDVELAHEAGFDEHVAKPTTIERLTCLLARDPARTPT